MNPQPALAVEEVTVTTADGAEIVASVSFSVRAGEVLGLVGESGSGKTTLSLTPLGYARPGARITAGRAVVAGQDLLAATEMDVRESRGRLIAYVPQDPASALNPSLRVEAQLREMLRAHRRAAKGKVVPQLLTKVGLPADIAFRRRFPHQLSGGQQQRLAIAIALSCEPAVLVLDEPTTGLDVVTQSVILAEVQRLCREMGVATVYISHDLAVVSQIAHRIAVMYGGRIIEHGPAADLLRRPRHPYTAGLVASIPDHLQPRRLRGIPGIAVGVNDRPPGCAFSPRCDQRIPKCEVEVPGLETAAPDHLVRCIRWQLTPELAPDEWRSACAEQAVRPLLAITGLRVEYRGRGGPIIAADNVSFMIGPRECLALVGESGSGKTSIARAVAGLHPPTSGEVLFDGRPLAPRASGRPSEIRRRIQIVFQNPYDSLNPKHTVEHAIARPLRLFRMASGERVHARVVELLDQVRLPGQLAGRYPAELSGGERQRVAIARAIAAAPDLLICDEVTSALDVSVQAVVLDLLGELRQELGLALLFITHDLGLVASVADAVVVLEQGVIREQGAVQDVMSEPAHPYTRTLLDTAPSVLRAAPSGPA